MGEQSNREVEILNAALELSGSERVGYLGRACAGDDRLRQRVAELIRAHEQAESFLESPPAGIDFNRTARLNVPPAEKPGDRIGRYKLLQQIGEGGCGVVYMAEQEEPVRRRVALKVIKLGMDTKQVIARFEAERQALALMDHSHIAKVLDAGATETGRPYFVMELVRGVKITDFCDENNLSTDERLKLFIQVCQAVQHAHQKGIIHRDIKPSNILVTVNDGVPVPKVIDFGIAKATQGRLTDHTLFTAFEQFLGTPAYMSPEQAVMTSLDIDTRSDIYSLGVLLYELLTGKTPFDQKELLAAGLVVMRQTILEREPERPSARLSTMAVDALTTTANRRQTEAPRLIHSVRGDLDWIVMKSLEKDRARRYETANGLAADIQRHLNDEPVNACPPSGFYRLQKAIRRNRLAFGAAGAVALALVAGVIVSSSEAVRATRAEQQQNNLRKAAEQSQRVEVQQRREAEAARAEEARQRHIASEQEMLARRRYYAAQMNLASQAWEAGQIPRTMDLLETQRPRSGQEDLRGFEWFYLWRLCNGQLICTIRAHTRQVNSVAFSPDGTLLASASVDGTIRFWDTATGVQKSLLTAPPPEGSAAMTSVAFSPDGKTLISGGWDAQIRIWDVDTGTLRATPSKQTDWVRSLAISPDGKTLAVGGDGGMLRLLALGTGQEWANLKGHVGTVTSISFSPDGTALASSIGWGDEGSFLNLWTLTNGLVQSITNIAGQTDAVAFSPDGKTLATASHSEIKLWDAATSQLQYTLKGHVGPISSVAFLPDGNSLVSCGNDRTIRLWGLSQAKRENSESRIIGAHLAGVSCLAVSKDGTILATGDTDGSIKLWNLAAARNPTASQVSNRFKFGDDTGTWDGLQSVLVSPDGHKLYVITEHGAEMRDIASGLRLSSWPQMAGRGVLSPDGKLLATTPKRDDGMVKLWDIADGHLLASVQAHPDSASGFFISMAFTQDGKILSSASPWSGNGSINSGGPAPKGGDPFIRLWDTHDSLKPIRAIATPSSAGISALGSSPDGKVLAFATRHTQVLLVDATTGHIELGLTVEKGVVGVNATVFSPDGHLLATAGDGGLVKLWDVRTGQLHTTLHGHASTVWTVAFSPDGNTVATGSDDTTVRLWDAATGQERIALQGHSNDVTSVAFTPDGAILIAGHQDGFVDLWHGERVPQAEVEEASMEEIDQSAADNLAAWRLATDPDPKRRDGQKAVELAEKAVMAGNQKNPEILDTLAAAFAETGSFTNAVRVEREAMALLNDEETKSDFAVRLNLYLADTPYRDDNTLAEEISNLLAEGNYAGAEPLAVECLRLRARTIPDDWRMFNARSMLGACLLGQQKYVEAEPLLRSGYEGMRQRQAKIPQNGKIWLQNALQRLVQLCQKTNRPDEADAWNKKLAELSADSK